MLVLSTLTKLLDQVLSENDVHTAILLTPNGELVSFSSSTTRPKDDVRVLVGLSREVWSETRGEEEGMLDSEMGRLLVVPIVPPTPTKQNGRSSPAPVMLLALNASNNVDWGIMQIKGQSLAAHFSKPMSELATISSSPVTSSGPRRR